MILTDLNKGDVFTLEGRYYEVDYVSPSGRIVMCYVLEPTHNFDKRYPLGVADNYLDTTLERVPDPNDVVGGTYLTTVFSDLRFNREHETQEDRDARDVI